MSELVSELEQQEYFTQLARKTSESLAIFYCCIKYDVPFARDCVPRDEGARQVAFVPRQSAHQKSSM